MVRTGLLRPIFCLMEEQAIEMGFREVMKKLSEHGYLILVADTSAFATRSDLFLTQNPIQCANLDRRSSFCHDRGAETGTRIG